MPENFLYEWNQYLLILLLLIAGLVTSRQGSTLPRLVVLSVVGSLAVVTGIGVIQWFLELPILKPIDPGLGVAYPSLMGYKNPAALAVLGQFFLLIGLLAKPSISLRWRACLASLAIVELAYLASPTQPNLLLRPIRWDSCSFLVLDFRPQENSDKGSTSDSRLFHGFGLRGMLAAQPDTRKRFASGFNYHQGPSNPACERSWDLCSQHP